MSAPFDPSHPESWPPVMKFDEVCQVLRIAPRTGYRLREMRQFPVPALLLPGAPKFLKDDVLQALKSRSGQASALERRKALHGVR